MELTPRTLDETAGAGGRVATPRRAPGRARRRRWLPLAVLTVALVALGLLVMRGLSDATLYFRNVDEAVDQRDSLGAKRFRLQGSVVDEPVETGDAITFAVAFNGVSVDVHHVGNPPELFRPGIPVVLEGHWDSSGEFFDSDRIMVKHDETYESVDDYDMRMGEARQGGDAGA